MPRLLPTIAIVLAASLAAPAGAQQSLSRPEQRMRDWIRTQTSQQVAFLEKVVNINSGTMNFAGIRATGAEFARELEALGFETRWEDASAVNRGGNLFAEHRARRRRNSGKTVLVLGHLDTVFEGEGQRFTLENDSIAKGAGVEDMKGGDVVILWALKAMAAAGTLADADIIVALMGDEESSGEPDSISRRGLVEAAKRSQAILAFEGDAGKATIARRGFSSWRLTVSARQAHSSGIFSERSSYGAIYEAARIVNAFRDSLREPNLTFNPGIFLGGTNVKYDSAQLAGTVDGKLNIIAPSAVVEGDLRFLTPGQLDSARNRMRSIVSQSLPGASATITFTDGNPAMPPTPGNYALLAVLDTVTRALGHGPTEALEPGRRGAGDISYISEYADALDGLGVMGSGAHSPDERINLKSLPVATERAAVLIHRLTRRRR